MKAGITIRKRQSEAGIALLISIFILLLISVVAIALVVSSGTETALAGNYRSATGVYYAALAGLEEARGRLSTKNPNYFGNTSPGFLPPPGIALAVGSPIYVINPAGTEVVAPWNPTSTYPDNQFNPEFASSGFTLPNPSPSTPSIWNNSPLNSLSFPGPLYKWVRINAVSEKSLNLDVYPYDGIFDPTTPVYYDGTRLNIQNTGAQVFEITSLAVLPNGSQKLVQYLTAPVPITLPPFLATMSLLGSSLNGIVSFSSPPAPPANTGFKVLGIDQDCTGNPTGAMFLSIGVLHSNDVNVVKNGGNGGTGIIPAYLQFTPANNYQGSTGSPAINNIYSTFPLNLQKPSALDAIAQTLIQNADATVPIASGAVQQAFLTSLGMSPTNPMTVVVNGNLDLTAWHNTGYGLLLVTGTLNYDPDASWKGIVLVIGQGALICSKNGIGEIDGALMVAKTRNSTGTLLADPYLGASSVNYNSGSPIPTSTLGGVGLRYSSCWIQKAQPTTGNKILSFHEIAQ